MARHRLLKSSVKNMRQLPFCVYSKRPGASRPSPSPLSSAHCPQSAPRPSAVLLVIQALLSKSSLTTPWLVGMRAAARPQYTAITHTDIDGEGASAGPQYTVLTHADIDGKSLKARPTIAACFCISGMLSMGAGVLLTASIIAMPAYPARVADTFPSSRPPPVPPFLPPQLEVLTLSPSYPPSPADPPRHPSYAVPPLCLPASAVAPLWPMAPVLPPSAQQELDPLRAPQFCNATSRNTGTLSCSACAAMLRDPKHKFWGMWGVGSFRKMQDGHAACWGLDAAEYFDSVISGAGCDINWFEGTDGVLGDGASRPVFTSRAPALLGFDESILAFCNSIIGVQQPVAVLTRGEHIFNRQQNNDVAHHCVQANQNILRLLSSRRPWNMCRSRINPADSAAH
jgi:hypothetical protein